ncbi:hypothetical protein GCM10010341_77970 [Streptomyces noursei]|nr:hypothetical protein GCM10010341_77970 [Streptomyces noursei]
MAPAPTPWLTSPLMNQRQHTKPFRDRLGTTPVGDTACVNALLPAEVVPARDDREGAGPLSTASV